jgi:hypothetical protein
LRREKYFQPVASSKKAKCKEAGEVFLKTNEIHYGIIHLLKANQIVIMILLEIRL